MKKPLNLSVEADLVEEMKIQAVRENRTVSEIVEQLCPNLAGVNTNQTGIYLCTPNQTIKVAMWSVESNLCSPHCYQTKYLGAFVVTKYVNANTGAEGLYGYFSTLASAGTFSGTSSSPLQKIALVY